jgi:hypothetical protein
VRRRKDRSKGCDRDLKRKMTRDDRGNVPDKSSVKHRADSHASRSFFSRKFQKGVAYNGDYR